MQDRGRPERGWHDLVWPRTDRPAPYTGGALPVLLEHRTRFWPVMLFPHIERSHTATVIGRCGWRPVWLKDVVYGAAGTIALTPDKLIGRTLLISWFEIDRSAIESVRLSPRAEGVLEVRFGAMRKSWFIRFVTFQKPDGLVLLNLGDSCGEWLAALAGGSAG